MELQEYSYDVIDTLYNRTVDIIKTMQGNKKYIQTQSDSCDKMYFYTYSSADYNNGCGSVDEGEIRGIRIYNNEIQFLGTTRFYINKFDDDDFERASENYDKGSLLDDYESCWQDVRCSEFTLLVPTLFSIAEVIEEYKK